MTTVFRNDVVPGLYIVYLDGNAGQWAPGTDPDDYALTLIRAMPEVLDADEALGCATILSVRLRKDGE